MSGHRTTGPELRAPGRLPLYARVLGLQHIRPGGLLCFLFFEAVIALAVVLALVGFASLWGVLVLPLTVAAMVKLNDVVAGLLAAATRNQPSPRRREAAGTPPSQLAGCAAIRDVPPTAGTEPLPRRTRLTKPANRDDSVGSSAGANSVKPVATPDSSDGTPLSSAESRRTLDSEAPAREARRPSPVRRPGSSRA